MGDQPIRVVISDDLERNRWTVFFRWLLAIPHYIWVFVWSLLALALAIISWLVMLVTGTMPAGLHGFQARYVRYVTQLWAYLLLTASPYPSFGGDPGYPVDVEVDPPVRQSRAKVAFRIVLAVPALLVANGLLSAGGGAAWRSQDSQSYGYSVSGAAVAAAIVAWFACLARGRMPHGIRDLQAYCLRYGAQTWGYVLLLTDRYPSASPADPAAAQPDAEPTVALEVTDDLARSRLTVFFRLLLALPLFVWFVLWTVVVIPASFVAWIIMVVSGRLPLSLHRFFSAYLRFQVHFGSFVYLAANPFPGFVGAPGYPVELDLPAEPTAQGRSRSLVRFLLAIPAFIISGGLGTAVFAAAVVGWFASLITGRMPGGLRDLIAWSIRYSAQAGAYVLFVTERYPYSGPYEFAEPPSAEPQLLELPTAV